MSLPRLELTSRITDRLVLLENLIKTRSRTNLTDANQILESISVRFFNELFGWQLINLNLEKSNYSAADLGDQGRRLAVQITNQEKSKKITDTANKAESHNLGRNFDRLIIFFLLSRKPHFPRGFKQPPAGPKIVTWDIADLGKQLREMNLPALERAAAVLDEELGQVQKQYGRLHYDTYALRDRPGPFVGRKSQFDLLDTCWGQVQRAVRDRTRMLVLVALAGEGKTSLIARWAAKLAHQNWPDCDAAFAWSFYNQGREENRALSSDLFLKAALNFFGDDEDKAFAAGPASAVEKAQRLGRLVGRRRSLLILDGLETLQHALGSKAFQPGRLKDEAIAHLLKSLANQNNGLCIVTTRISVPDLSAFSGTTVRELRLPPLSRKHGVALLRALGVKGNLHQNVLLKGKDGKHELVNQFEKLVEDVRGHALTLTLLGSFLSRAFQGDIRQRDRVKFAKADLEWDGGHAFKVMAAYERWLLDSEQGRRDVAVLRLTGLFDRPIDSGCLAVLRHNRVVQLNEPLTEMSEEEWGYCLSGLESARLLQVGRESSGKLVCIDTHPLVRSYFAQQLSRHYPDAWRVGHEHLYEHLCSVASPSTRFAGGQTFQADSAVSGPSLEDLQPLYEAVAHGCSAGLHLKASNDVYRARIQRGDQCYSTYCLGAVASDLAALSNFFEHQWDKLVPGFPPKQQGWLFNETAYSLKALGRLDEALEAAQRAVAFNGPDDHEENAVRASNRSHLQLLLGLVEKAVETASLAHEHPELSPNPLLRMCRCAAYPDALHQAGRFEEAFARFQALEQDESVRQPGHAQLYSVAGFRFCDFLLSEPERIAWRVVLGLQTSIRECTVAKRRCREVVDRTTRALLDTTETGRPFERAITNLSRQQGRLYLRILNRGKIAHSHAQEMNQAVSELRTAGSQEFLGRGLLVQSWLRYLVGSIQGHGGALESLEEAWEIARSGPMKLLMTDIHLYRARLFLGNKRRSRLPANPPKNTGWTASKIRDDLDQAESLIRLCGYHRRNLEMSDARKIIPSQKILSR